MISIFVLSALVAAEIMTPAAIMNTRRTKRVDYVVRSSIKAAFEYSVPKTNNVVFADMDITTKMPALNLDNFEQIKTIDCSVDMLNLVFDTAASATAAYNEWSKPKELALFLSHEHRCKGVPKLATMVVKQVLKPVGAKLTIDTKSVTSKEVIQGFELDIKRSNMERDSITNFPLDMNYDRVSGTIKNPLITLYENQKGHLKTKYHTRGDATMALHLKSDSGYLQEYSLSLAGNMTGNMDLLVKTISKESEVIGPIKLWSLQLGPLEVPGVFVLRPEMLVQAKVSYETESTAEFGAGYDMSHNFKFAIESSDGFFSKPKVTFQGMPNVNMHPFSTNDGEGTKLRVVGSFSPAFLVNLDLFDSHAANVELAMHNALNLNAYTQIPLPKQICTLNGVSVELARSHSVSFALTQPTVLKYDVWKTGSIPVPCSL